MKSSNFNLHSTITENEINLLHVIENLHAFEVCHLTQAEYDVMTQHDETTTYVITDSKDGRMYIGSRLIPISKNDRQYLLGYDPYKNKYILYLNAVEGYIDHIAPISEFANPQDAINALITCNHLYDHNATFLKIIKVLAEYIIGNVGMNQTLISMISVLGYRDDGRLQDLNRLSIVYNDDQSARDISSVHKLMLHNEKDNNMNGLVSVYSDLYDLFVLNNFFKDYETIDDVDTATIRKFSKDVLSTLRSYKNR